MEIKRNFLIKTASIALIGIILTIPFFFKQGAEAAILPVGTINSCGTLAEAGTYTLSGSFSTTAAICFVITADGVIIDGAGYTVTKTSSAGTWAVSANSATGDAHDVEVRNITFANYTGGVQANVEAAAPDNDYIGGDITIATSTLGSIESTGGDGSASGTALGNGGVSGSITISTSTVGAITSTGGTGDNLGGDSGIITVNNSTTGAISSMGGGTYANSGDEPATGDSGDIVLTNSTVGAITSYGGLIMFGGKGGVSGNITLNNTDAVSITADTSLGILPRSEISGDITIENGSTVSGDVSIGNLLSITDEGYDTGSIIITDSSITGSVSNIGGSAGCGLLGGGDAGGISLDNSTVGSVVNTGGGSICHDGGSSGNVTIQNNSTVTGAITSTGGVGWVTTLGEDDLPGVSGIITVTDSSVGSIISTGGYNVGGTDWVSEFYPGVATSSGAINITNSTVGAITSTGGEGVDTSLSANSNGGDSGLINIINSTIASVTSTGGVGNGGVGGNSGLVALSNGSEVTGAITTSGGAGVASMFYVGNGGNSGNITLDDSTADSITSTGGAGDSSGNSGNISLSNGSAVTGAITNANSIGDSWGMGTTGDITLDNSTAGSISSVIGGGITTAGNSSDIIVQNNSTVSGTIVSTAGGSELGGANSGTITISESTTGAITSTGGGGLSGSDGGLAGAITISSSTVASVSSVGGAGDNGGSTGAITIATSTAGAITSTGQNATLGIGGSSGTITISSSTITSITSDGGDGVTIGAAGVSGSIIINNDSVITGAIASTGGQGDLNGGASGTITISTSTVASITSTGGNGNSATDGATPGTITLNNVTATSITSIAGGGINGVASGSIVLENNSSVTGAITTTGGLGECDGGPSGTISLSDSTTASIASTGGAALGICGFEDYYGGFAGDITLDTLSGVTGSITATGGESSAGYGGAGADITLNANSYVSGNVVNTGGAGTISSGANGTMTVSYTGSYTETEGNLTLSQLTVNDTDYGVFTDEPWPLFVGTINSCGRLSAAGATYTLGGDIGDVTPISSGSCFNILADEIILDGAGYTVTGTSGNSSYAINATVSGRNSYGTTTVTDITIAGFPNAIKAEGAANLSGEGYHGGGVIVSTSTLGKISVNGGNGSTNGGGAGTISISYSTSTDLVADGGNSTSCGNGGNGGVLSVIDSSYDSISAEGGDASGVGCGVPGSRGRQTIVITPPPAAPVVAQVSTPAVQTVSIASRPKTQLFDWNDGEVSRILPPVIQLQTLNLPSLPTFGEVSSGKNSNSIFSFIPKVSSFLFAPLPSSITVVFKDNPKLEKYFASSGVSQERDLIVIRKKPLLLSIPEKDIPSGLFRVTSNGKALDVFATTDKDLKLTELVRVDPGTSMTVVLKPTTKGKIVGQFQGKEIAFAPSQSDVSVKLTATTTPGTYILTTSASPIPLSVEVKAPKKAPSENGVMGAKLITQMFGWFVNLFK